MEYENFRKEFIKYNKLFTIPENEIEKFYQYMKLLLEWNEKINLTAITDESEIIRKHFIDSLTISKLIKEDTNVVDVGTGAGFPGMPLAITKKVKVTLVDSLNKRINFLNIVKESIELDNVNTVHGRAEEVGQNEKYREKFDYAVSRAVAPINARNRKCSRKIRWEIYKIRRIRNSGRRIEKKCNYNKKSKKYK